MTKYKKEDRIIKFKSFKDTPKVTAYHNAKAPKKNTIWIIEENARAY